MKKILFLMAICYINLVHSSEEQPTTAAAAAAQDEEAKKGRGSRAHREAKTDEPGERETFINDEAVRWVNGFLAREMELLKQRRRTPTSSSAGYGAMARQDMVEIIQQREAKIRELQDGLHEMARRVRFAQQRMVSAEDVMIDTLWMVKGRFYERKFIRGPLFVAVQSAIAEHDRRLIAQEHQAPFDQRAWLGERREWIKEYMNTPADASGKHLRGSRATHDEQDEMDDVRGEFRELVGGISPMACAGSSTVRASSTVVATSSRASQRGSGSGRRAAAAAVTAQEEFPELDDESGGDEDSGGEVVVQPPREHFRSLLQQLRTSSVHRASGPTAEGARAAASSGEETKRLRQELEAVRHELERERTTRTALERDTSILMRIIRNEIDVKAVRLNARLTGWLRDLNRHDDTVGNAAADSFAKFLEGENAI